MVKQTQTMLLVAAVVIAAFALGMIYHASFGPRTDQAASNANRPEAALTKLPDKTTDWLLVLCNIALAGFVVLQIRDARRSSERQLRAYIFVVKTGIGPSADGWKVSFRIRNFGQTPAHKVTISYAVEVVPWGDSGPTAVPVPVNVEKLGSIGPISDEFDFGDEPSEPVSIAELVDPTKAIYLVGRIGYDTVFGAGHTTSFRFYVGGDAGWDGPGEMTADEQGNDAT